MNYIAFFNTLRKRNYLNRSYNKCYAFVGIGNHSIHNLYPVLHFLGIRLKYIVSKTEETAALVTKRYAPVTGITDYDTVLNDSEIEGVIICADPKAHYILTAKALKAQKHVFVEKPPCSTTDELSDLIRIQKEERKICLVGLQRNYSACYSILKNKISKEKIISYSYKFVTGLYPNGDELLDLFIHNLSCINYLFGEYKLLSIHSTNAVKKQSGVTYFINLLHQDFIGNIELSTNYSWQNCKEILEVNQTNGVFLMEDLESLTFQKNANSLLRIPIEKILPSAATVEYLFSRNNSVPTIKNNQLYTNGYYNELLTFFNLTEQNKGANLSSLSSLQSTFELIQKIKDQHVF